MFTREIVSEDLIESERFSHRCQCLPATIKFSTSLVTKSMCTTSQCAQKQKVKN